MMKRDLQEYKYVGGAKVKNVPYKNKFNKQQNYLQRDINSTRLDKWETVRQLSERQPIDIYHKESNSHQQQTHNLKQNLEKDLFINENYINQKGFKPSLRHIEPKNSKSEIEIKYNKIKQKPQFKLSEEMDIFNQMQHELPHMRTKTPTGRQYNSYKVQVHSKELDEYNQRHLLPHMRTATPNNRQYGPPQEHILSNQTDFINQKKHLMPSMQNIQRQQIQKPYEHHKSQFELKWQD